MSGTALKDLNVLPLAGLEKKSDSSGKGGFMKTNIENTSEFLERKLNKVSASLAPLKEADLGGNGVEVGPEVEYIEFENLPDLPSVDTSLCVGAVTLYFLAVYLSVLCSVKFFI